MKSSKFLQYYIKE